MAHSTSICYSYTLNSQVLFYDGYGSGFDHKALNILRRHNIRYFILKAGDYVNDQPYNHDPNTKLNNFYFNARMNWLIDHGTLKFSSPQMNP